jgi:urease accessory protein
MLHVFKSLPVAIDVHRLDALPARAEGYRRDRVALGWEERLKGRGRRVSAEGLEFGTTLPRGTILRGGDCLVLDGPRAVVVVIERAEPVFVIDPGSAAEWGRIAYHIGNNHQPMMIATEGIVCPDVPGMEMLLAQHQIVFSRALRPFTPIGLSPDHRHI